MKYKVIYPDDLESIEFESFASAMKHMDSFPMDTQLSFRITGYSPITLEEAQMFCDNVNQEMNLLNYIAHGATVEEALVNVGIEL